MRLGKEKSPELVNWQEQHRSYPHQLRHNSATRIRRDFGPDAARAVPGQKCLDATEIYAEIDAASTSLWERWGSRPRNPTQGGRSVGLAGKVPVKQTHLADGERVPPADQCPDCGGEWPMLVMETPVCGRFLVLSPLPYNPVSPG
jgi:hypothetical protein